VVILEIDTERVAHGIHVPGAARPQTAPNVFAGAHRRQASRR
jgi:hypothetical protein